MALAVCSIYSVGEGNTRVFRAAIAALVWSRFRLPRIFIGVLSIDSIVLYLSRSRSRSRFKVEISSSFKNFVSLARHG
jgi:hypothetical protein